MLRFNSSLRLFSPKVVFSYFIILFFIFGVRFSQLNSLAHADSTEVQIEELTAKIETLSSNEAQLKEVVQKRKELLIEKARNDPSGFLRVAKLASKRNTFLASIQPSIEEQVQKEGELIVVHFDSKDRSKIDYKLIGADKAVYDLRFVKNTLETLKSGIKIKVMAIGIEKQLVVEAPNQATSTTSMQALSTPQNAPLGEQKTAVILVNFSNDHSTPISKNDLNNLIFAAPNSVSAYYKENSFSKTILSGQVLGPYTLSKDNSSCDYNYYSWSTEADDLANAGGANLSSYNNIVYVFSTPPNCSWGGLGTIGGAPARSWIFNYFSDSRVYAHELGHNIGVGHANSLSCKSKQIDQYFNCTQTEYGDVYDVMGNFWYVSPAILQFNAAHKVDMGWIPSNSLKSISVSGVYQIYPLEKSTSNTQVLKINKPDTGESYIVSYRQPFGFDSSLQSGVTRGVSIHILPYDPAIQTKLIDTTPGTGDFSGFADATLQDSKKFTDPTNNIQILQMSHSGTFAQVQVTLPDTTLPTVSISSPSNGIKVTKNTFIKVVANATDDVAVKKVEFRRNGVLVCSSLTAPYSCFMMTDSVSKKDVTYQAKAYDAANNSTTTQVVVATK